MKRLMALFLAYFFVALAIVGVFLPLVPTVPFLLLALYFAARGSTALHQWLLAHPYFGKQLSDWSEQRAISRSSKTLAVSSLLVSWLMLLYLSSKPWLWLGLALLFIIVAGYIVTRAEPKER